jgi:hypothetical protein
MNRLIKAVLLASTMLATAAFMQGCATKIKPSATQNPPPLEAFNAYGRIQVKTAVFKSGVHGSTGALAKINENIQFDLAQSLKDWNKRPDNGRTLIIEPVIEEISFKNAGTRVFLGPLAGSSGVLMRLNISDDKGRVIASPEFFQRAGAMAAGFMMGVHDNLMLTRVANLSTRYVIANYSDSVGGPTGGDLVVPAK